ncbi:hypothetical protein SAY87_008060 [Trapa incisa]|uniref:RRM domain-containing protein n=1 Tax=Trapa incisa TaxID=236973 RepID=A0AAN7KKK6_9MYRT|nr:hypothetical protein SAY87_008060 [Trapa incisa]
MAALGRLCGSSSIQLRRSIAPPALLIPCRGIVSKLFVGGIVLEVVFSHLYGDSFSSPEEISFSLARFFFAFVNFEKLRMRCLTLVLSAKIIMDRVSDRSKGFGFVSFASEDEAYNAVTEMNGKTLNGRVIFVDYAKPRAGYSGGMPIARGPPEPITSHT